MLPKEKENKIVRFDTVTIYIMKWINRFITTVAQTTKAGKRLTARWPLDGFNERAAAGQ